MGWEVFNNFSLASWGPQPISPGSYKSFLKRLWTKGQGCHLVEESTE